MTKNTKKIQLIFSITISLLVLILLSCGYYWQQISGLAQPIAIFIILGLSLIIVIKLIISLNTVYKLRSVIGLKFLMPSIIYTLTLFLVFSTPKWLFVDYYLSKTIYHACYEGTMNDATIRFRESGEFEFRDVGFFATTTFIKGKWTKNGDTIFINSKSIIPKFVGNKLLLSESSFINISTDTIGKHRSVFYRGYCKGLN